MRVSSLFGFRQGGVSRGQQRKAKRSRRTRRQLLLEPLEQRHLLSVVTITANDDPGGNGANNGIADLFRLVRNADDLEVYVNGNFVTSAPLAGLTAVQVGGSSDADELQIDLSGGAFSTTIQFDGEALGLNVAPQDSLTLLGDPGAPIGRVTYAAGPLFGGGADDGFIILDPDDNNGPGGGWNVGFATWNGDELMIQFANLSPVYDVVPAAQVDVFATHAAETISILDGILVSGYQTAKVSASTFEDYFFANKTRVTVNSLNGGDTFILNYNVTVPGLQLLDLYGNELTGGTLNPDDAQAETFQILATGPGTVANRMYGQRGAEYYTNSLTSYLDPIQSNVQMHGGEGISIIDLSDVNDPTGDNIFIWGNKIVGAATGTIELYFATIEDIRFEATSGDDVITVLSTFADFQYRISGGPGNDTFNVGSYDTDPSPGVSLAWGPYGTGLNTIGQIKGQLTIIPGPAWDAGDDTLYVDDSGGLAGYGAAMISDAAGGAVLGRTTTLLNFDAAAPIKYEYTPGGSELENLFIHTSQAADNLVVNATTARNTEIDLGPGSDFAVIAGDYVAGANVFKGGSGADTLWLHVLADLGGWAVLPLTQLQIEGNDPGGTVGGGDVVSVRELGVGVPRALDFAYSGSGDVLLTGLAMPVDIRTAEVVEYLGGSGNDDTLSVTGTAADDLITVAPLSGDAARVFLGGDPWDGPAADGDFFDQFPGVAGGGAGPDLHIAGAANLYVDAAGGSSNRLYIYAPSEDDLTDGASVIVPGLGSGNAYDEISVTDSSVTINNNSLGALLPITFDSAALVQAIPTDRGLVVNAGFEATPDAAGLADQIYAMPSSLFAIMVNGGDPVPAFAPNGDRLDIGGWGDVDIWADKNGTVSVAISGVGTFPVDFSSIENLAFWVWGAVNIYGDNNDPGVDQNDLFEIVGTGYHSFALSINGNAPIQFFGVTDLNIFGDDATGTPSVGPNDVDTLVITPFADNSPQGWGINISFDEGNPTDGTSTVPDLIIYNGIAGVSERIELVPTGPGDGQLRVTNAADGSLVTVINYISNTGFIINGNDGSAGDTDSLTLHGTSGDDAIHIVDAQNANVSGIYSVQFTNFAVLNVAGGDGYDTFHVNPSTLQVVIDGGTPDGVIQSDGDHLYVWPGLASYHLILGPEGDNGTVAVTGAAPITFDRIEGLGFQGILYTLPDLNEPNDTIAEATILGSIPHLTLRDLTIHTNEWNTTNDDYFQITARDSGALLVNVMFTDDGIGGNQVAGALSAELLDRLGNVIATAVPTAYGVQIVAPVVSQQRYYVRVFSTDNDPNTYTLEIENFAAPAPTAIVMHPAYDTGRSDSDGITAADDPVMLIQAWLSDLAEKGVPVLSAADVAAGLPGLAVEVFVNGISAGFADPFGPSNNVFAFALPSGLLSAGLPGGYAGNPTAFGWLNLISAAVRVFDAQTVPASATRELGIPLPVTYDPNVPDASLLTLALATSCDSGVVGDGVTNIRTPTFQGVSEINTIVRLYANGQLVGQATTGSDLSDGILGNGLGVFSITAAPLTDGVYFYAVTVEDVAGNITGIVDSPIVILQIDTTPPQIPTIDLLDQFDTGWSDKDNVTKGDLTQGPGVVDVRVSGELGTTAVIKDGETVIDTFVFAAAFMTRTLTLGEGPHPLTIEVTDTAGNRTQSEQLLITVDTIAPDPASISLAPYSDSGIPGDGITNVSAPAFVGLAEANARVRLYVDDGTGPVLAGWTIVQSDESDGDPTNGLGVWEITVEPLADGEYTVWVEVEDLAGNISDQSEAIEITIDTTSPQRPTLDLQDADDTGWYDLDNVTIGDPLQLPAMGIVDLRISADPSSLVIIKDGNTPVAAFVFDLAFDSTDGVIDGFGLYTISFPVNEFLFGIPAEGPHPLSVESVDAAGNVAQSEQLLVTIDYTPPAASAPALAGYSDSGISGDGITNVSAPAFVGSAEANARVRLYVDDGTGPVLAGWTIVQSDESDGDPTNGLGRWEITVEPLTDGTYVVWVEVEDLAGNISDEQDNLALGTEVTIDTTPPQIPTIDLVDQYDTGWYDKDNVTTGDPNALGTVRVRISAEYGTLVLIKDGEVVIDSFVFDAAFDATDGVPGDLFGVRTIDFVLNQALFSIPAEGPHPLTVEAVDVAGNFRQSEQLLVTIDFTPPLAPSAPDMLPDSDTGAFDDDNVTSIKNPAFWGVGEPNSLVRIYVVNSLGQERLVGQATVGSDESYGDPTDNRGIWEVTIEPLDDGVYDVFAELEDQAGNISVWSAGLRIEIDTYAPNTPYLDLITADDSGRSNVDNITRVNTPNFTAATSDPNELIHLFAANLRYRVYDRTEGSGDVLIYDTGALVTSNSITTGALGPLADGVHNLKLEVEDRAGNISADFLLTIVVDTEAPPAAFGLFTEVTDGLHPHSDTGLVGLPALADDRITSDTTPTVWGQAEANSIIRVFVDANRNGRLDGTDVLLGQTTAVPLDGNQAEPFGYWEITSVVDLNDPLIFAQRDGARTLFMQAVDVAGNESEVQRLDIFLDTRGPRVESVFITSAPAFDLFNPKPSDGPTPLVDQLSIVITDGPDRAVGWLYNALALNGAGEFAVDPGHFSLVGDANGVIPIAGITFVADPLVPGAPARGTLVLTFAEPLPDDRFTLTISDELRDPAGNRLDGESNAVEPHETPSFPSGDGMPGGRFVARFTVDSRPEVGVWAAGSVWVDTNGNEVFDPENLDFTNRDIVYAIGLTSDDIFAGNFALSPGDVADGFDKLAAYGRVNGAFRWLIDTNNDGVPDINLVEPAAVNGLPIAGRFDNNDANGDEVAVVTAFPPAGEPSYWYFDTDHDYQVDNMLTSQLRGYPVVGDFDGDGFDDLATWMDDTFYVDLANGVRRGWDGVADYTFRFGFIGIRERPVVADMDQDGFDDFGLWVPDRTGQINDTTGEFYFLVSGGQSVLNRIVNDPIKGYPKIDFVPKPFGNDIFIAFGNQYALPVVGNFDPPVVPMATTTTNLMGTDGDDVLEFVAGDTAANWVVRLNGIVQTLDPATTDLVVDLGGGNDQVTFTGAAGDDVIDVSPGRFVFTGTGYTVTVLNAEVLQADAGGGSDSANFTGTDGDDTFTARPGSAQIIAAGLNAQVNNVETIRATAGSGGTQDVATLYDSAGDDVGQITPTGAVLSGTGFRLEASGFDFTHLVAKNGGNDAVLFVGTAGQDELVARPDYSTMTLADGTFYRAKGFKAVEIAAPAGNQSSIKFVDSAGDDTFQADPTTATLRGAGYEIVAHRVAYVHAYSRNGGFDSAYLYGSDGDDRIVVDQQFMKIYGDSYLLRAKGFELTIADALDGADSAKVLDTAGDDTVTAEPYTFRLQTRKQEFRGYGVETQDIRSIYGGTDTVSLYDSTYDDVLTAQPNYAGLTGPGYAITVRAYDSVYAYSRSGHDIAHLTGSSGDDQFVGDAVSGRLSGLGFLLRAKNFSEVYVQSGGGRDSAVLKATAAVDQIFANGLDAVLENATFKYALRAFSRVQVNGSGANDLAEVWNGQILHQEYDLDGNPLPEPDVAVMVTLNDVAQVRVRSDVPPQDETVDGLGQTFKFFW
ncbi:MAG TPA: Ig-like domain-containing protein [Thermogutta sp.]|nr:Ig-like domain-containing protein [Thermogutta sp.]